jgi:hypothetical protein
VTNVTGKFDGLKKNRPKTSPFPYQYDVYGICLRCEFPLSLPASSGPGLMEIDVLIETANFFSDWIRDTPLQPSPFRNFFYGHLDDGSSYVQWDGLGEFLVSADGGRITCRRFDEALPESFQVYLLGQAISFALVKNGLEPLHATCVVIDGKAVAFLGNSGFGKSSLAACCLEAGHRLLTDDLLVLQATPAGFQAYPGPPRIKLFSEMAGRFLGEIPSGMPMNNESQKLVMPLESERICSDPVLLAALYAITAPGETEQEQGVRIEPVSSREAFVLLMNNVFNYVIADPMRLQRQFRAMTGLAAVAPVKRLSYPRLAEALPLVREAIVADLL